MNEPGDQQFHKKILEKITSGKVTMHSKAYLVWRGILLFLGIALLAVLGIFVASFIFFIVRANGTWDLPQFGLHGLREFLVVFPWLFIPALLLFLWLIERFVVQHSSAYRLPVLYTALGLIVIIIVGSIVVLATPLHEQLYRSARESRLPLAGSIYRFFDRNRPDDFYVGRVVSVNGHTYTMQTPEGALMTVTTDSNTRWFMNSPIVPGDCLEIIGEEQKQNTTTAMAIRKSDSNITVDCHAMPPPGFPVNNSQP